MKAVVHDRYGPPEVLRIEDVERKMTRHNAGDASRGAGSNAPSRLAMATTAS